MRISLLLSSEHPSRHNLIRIFNKLIQFVIILIINCSLNYNDDNNIYIQNDKRRESQGGTDIVAFPLNRFF